MKNHKDYVAKDLSAELAHATSLVPKESADESTYAKARSAALDAGAAAEAFARGDSDAGLQAIERTVRGFRGIAADFGLELAEVLPTEPCRVCGILTADFHSVPSVASPTHYLCATCVREAVDGEIAPTTKSGSADGATAAHETPDDSTFTVEAYFDLVLLTMRHCGAKTQFSVDATAAVRIAWDLLRIGSSAMAGRRLELGPAGVTVRSDGTMVVFAGTIPVFAIRPEAIDRFAADVAAAAASRPAPSNDMRPMVLQ